MFRIKSVGFSYFYVQKCRFQLIPCMLKEYRGSVISQAASYLHIWLITHTHTHYVLAYLPQQNFCLFICFINVKIITLHCSRIDLPWNYKNNYKAKLLLKLCILHLQLINNKAILVTYNCARGPLYCNLPKSWIICNTVLPWNLFLCLDLVYICIFSKMNHPFIILVLYSLWKTLLK